MSEASTDQTADKRNWRNDLFSIPNGMTLYRLLAAPWAYKAVAKNPKGKWLSVGLVSTTDFEGNAARLEKLPVVGKFLAKIGFRTSEIGRQIDPVADFIYGGAVALGGLKSGAIPASVAKAALTQKVVKGGITIAATFERKTLEVNNTGKAGEVLTALGSYGCIAAEAIENPNTRLAAKIAGSTAALGGVALSWLSTIGGYANDAGYLDTPRLRHLLERSDTFLERFTPGT